MKTFVILGMHRSATSLLAKGLDEVGVYMGDELLGPDNHNIYGHYEDIDFLKLNIKILETAGGSWDNPPEEEAILSLRREFGNKIESLVRKKEREPFWGWKDPRTTLTVRLFHPYLRNPIYYAAFRDPWEVGISLKTRNPQFSREEAMKLGKIYNERLLSFLNDITRNAS